MTWPLVLLHALLPASVGAVAALGAWRCWRLLRYAPDARLRRLMAFYALFAASLVPMVVRTALIAASVGPDLPLAWTGGARTLLHGKFVAAQEVDALLVAHHALMLAGLVVAVGAFRHGRASAGFALGLAFLAPFLWLALALEAALTFYLAILALQNTERRRTRGAHHVAAGFLLFFLGHLSFFVLYHPIGVRTPIGDALSLAGLALLVRLLPRPAA